MVFCKLSFGVIGFQKELAVPDISFFEYLNWPPFSNGLSDFANYNIRPGVCTENHVCKNALKSIEFGGYRGYTITQAADLGESLRGSPRGPGEFPHWLRPPVASLPVTSADKACVRTLF